MLKSNVDSMMAMTPSAGDDGADAVCPAVQLHMTDYTEQLIGDMGLSTRHRVGLMCDAIVLHVCSTNTTLSCHNGRVPDALIMTWALQCGSKVQGFHCLHRGGTCLQRTFCRCSHITTVMSLRQPPWSSRYGVRNQCMV